jgi:2-C-methyl-D-erythritol 4-phosphate cytidylyltransferase
VRLVPGSPENLKITTPADLAQADRILEARRRKPEARP